MTYKDTPDWVRIVQVAVTVENVPVVPAETTEVAAGDTGRYSGTDQTYQTVASWTVSASKIGELKEIVILTTEWEKTEIQITIAGTVWVTDWISQGALPLVFADVKLDAADEVLVEAQSTDGSSIVVDCAIVGKEVG